MDNSAQLFRVLDELVDRWCERRALRPLQILLPAYPPAPLHTDQWATLYATVRRLKGLAAGELLDQEAAAVAEAHALLYQHLKQTDAGAGILAAAG